MRHLNPASGVPDRYLPEALAICSSDSYPIPAWKTEATTTEIAEIERLKQFCTQKFAYLQPSRQPANSQSSLQPLVQFIGLVGCGTSLCLNAQTSLPSSRLTSTLSLIRPNVNTLYLEPAQARVNLLPLRTPVNIEQAAAHNASAAEPKLNSETARAAKSTRDFMMPVEGFTITSPFGNRVHPIFGDQRFHQGIDIATPNGTPVKPAKAGYVRFVGWDGGYGKKIIIDHGDGYETLYAHLDQLLVKAGEYVTQKTIIGLSGSTGYVTGPHLHFELRLHQVARNPLEYL